MVPVFASDSCVSSHPRPLSSESEALDTKKISTSSQNGSPSVPETPAC